MVDNIISELESLSGRDKEDNETINEYILRLGEEADIEPETVEQTSKYITGILFGREPPKDEQAYQEFCRKIESLDKPSQDSTSTKEDAEEISTKRESTPEAKVPDSNHNTIQTGTGLSRRQTLAGAAAVGGLGVSVAGYFSWRHISAAETNTDSNEIQDGDEAADGPIPLQTSQRVDVEDVGPQGLRNISVRNGIAYISDRSKFTAFDVSDPDDASLIGVIDDEPEVNDGEGTGVNDFVLYDNYSIISNRYGNRLTIIDISDPASMDVESSIVLHDAENLYGITFHESDRMAYLCGRDSASITAVDLSDFSSPQEIGHLSDKRLDGATGVDIIDSEYLIATSRSTHRVVTIDTSDPSTLSVADSIQDPDILEWADEVIVEPRDTPEFAYHVGGTKSDPNPYFASIDISNPGDISIANSLFSESLEEGGSVGADIKNEYVYASRRVTGGIVTFDVSNKDEVAEIDSIQVGGDGHDSAVSEEYVYELQPTGRIYIIGSS